MKRVYLIMVGEYSDRRCAGWCATEDEARRVCAARNSAGGRGSDWYEVEECECLDGSVAGDVCAGWSYPFEFVKGADGWRNRWGGDAYLNSRHAPVVVEEPPVVFDGWSDAWCVRVRVWRKDEDAEAAQKAALDALYAYLAKKEGVMA